MILPGDSERLPELGDIVIVIGPETMLPRAAIVATEPEPGLPGSHRLDLYVLAIPPRIEPHVAPATNEDGPGWFWRDGSDVIEVIRQEGADTRRVAREEAKRVRAVLGGS